MIVPETGLGSSARQYRVGLTDADEVGGPEIGVVELLHAVQPGVPSWSAPLRQRAIRVTAAASVGIGPVAQDAVDDARSGATLHDRRRNITI